MQHPLRLNSCDYLFTKKIPDWYIIKKKSPYAIVDESFISDYNVIPSGLWVELIKVCEKIQI